MKKYNPTRHGNDNPINHTAPDNAPVRHVFTLGDDADKVVAKLTLEGEPCSGS